MKKTLLIALAGMTLLFFPQCSSLKVSKEYKDVTNVLKNCEKRIADASDCDDLENAVFFLTMELNALEDYHGKDLITKKEEEKLSNYADEVQKKYDLKAAKFGCEDEYEYEYE